MLAAMAPPIDCVLCGSCVVDMLCRPVDLTKPIGSGVLHQVDPILLTGGGITSNAGVTMARMGMKISVFSLVGHDAWSPVIRNLYRAEGIDDGPLIDHPTGATSTTVVVISENGERSFYHCVGAQKMLAAKDFFDHIDLFARARMMLLGYYSLLTNVENDLPEVFRRIRAVGCKTAMDSAGTGGALSPLDKILPHLDVWVPSHNEAKTQTGESDPRKIIGAYRACGAPGLVGVKLGSQGVLLSPKVGEFIQIDVAKPPGPVVDTTGAGDSFYGGLLTGLLKGLSVEQAGRLGAAAGACCVTVWGGSGGGRDYTFTAKLAGI